MINGVELVPNGFLFVVFSLVYIPVREENLKYKNIFPYVSLNELIWLCYVQITDCGCYILFLYHI